MLSHFLNIAQPYCVFVIVIDFCHENIVCFTPSVRNAVVLQVSAWGGYVFIINLIPLHVFVLLLMQRFSRRLYIGESPVLCVRL